MKSTHIALLRGINVGSAKRISMADLRQVFEELGYVDVRTLLNSGNVVFTSARALPRNSDEKLRKAIEAHSGVDARVTLVSATELRRIIDGNPLLDVAKDPSRLLVAVLSASADRANLDPLVEQNWGRERFALGDREAYLWCAEGIIDSPLAKALQRAVGDRATSRNWATVLKLHGLAQSDRSLKR